MTSKNCCKTKETLRVPAKASKKDYYRDARESQDTKSLKTQKKQASIKGEFKIKSYKHTRKQTIVINY